MNIRQNKYDYSMNFLLLEFLMIIFNTKIMIFTRLKSLLSTYKNEILLLLNKIL